jgi:hypothetical protein
MLTLVQPAPEGQDPPKRRRRGIPSPALSLTHDEACAVRAAARNIARAQYGSLAKLARALGITPGILTRSQRPSAGLAVALARVSGMTVDAVLGRTKLAVAPSPGGAS